MPGDDGSGAERKMRAISRPTVLLIVEKAGRGHTVEPILCLLCDWHSRRRPPEREDCSKEYVNFRFESWSMAPGWR